MKSIQIHIPELLEKVREMSDRHMETVTLSIQDEAIDQGVLHPAFLHFEACAQDASAVDFESIDALNCCDGQS